MLKIKVSENRKYEDFVAVIPHTGLIPMPGRNFLAIVSICIFSLVCSLPVGNYLVGPEDLKNSLFSSKSSSLVEEKYLLDEQTGSDIQMAAGSEDQENYDDVNLPKEFFIDSATGETGTLTAEADTETDADTEGGDTIYEETASRPSTFENLKDFLGLGTSAKIVAEAEKEEEEDTASIFSDESIDSMIARKQQEIRQQQLEEELLAAKRLEEAQQQAKDTALAAQTPKPEEEKAEPRPSGTWYEWKAKKGDTIYSVFEELNLPSGTLKRIRNRAKRSELAIHAGEEIHFLIDKNNIVLEMVKPLNKNSQIRFTRQKPNAQFTVVYEKPNEHASKKELSSMLAAADMPLAVQGRLEREKRQKEEQLALEQQKKEERDHRDMVANRPRLVIGTINPGEDFSKAAYRHGLKREEIAFLEREYAGRLSTSKMRAGDKFRILFSYAGAGSAINAAELSVRNKKVAIYRNLENRQFYEENEFRPTEGVFRRFPIAGQIKVNSPFNPRRMHPIRKRIAPHNGVDLKVPVGTPVYAPADGVVTMAGYMRGGGYSLIIKHAGNYSTVYMHLSKFDVRKGQRVHMGQVIAKSGNTGRSTGPHLHYEIRINDRPVDPLKVELPVSISPRIARQQRENFEGNVRSLKTDLYRDSLAFKK